MSKWKNTCVMSESYLLIQHIRSEPQFRWSSPQSEEILSPSARSVEFMALVVFLHLSSQKLAANLFVWYLCSTGMWELVLLQDFGGLQRDVSLIIVRLCASVYNQAFKMWSCPLWLFGLKKVFVVGCCCSVHSNSDVCSTVSVSVFIRSSCPVFTRLRKIRHLPDGEIKTLVKVKTLTQWEIY